jgi:hypothetical protein
MDSIDLSSGEKRLVGLLLISKAMPGRVTDRLKLFLKTVSQWELVHALWQQPASPDEKETVL